MKFKPVNIKPANNLVCWHCKKKSQYKCPETLKRYCGLNCYKRLKQDMKKGVIKPVQQLSKGSDTVSPAVKKRLMEGGTSSAIHTATLAATGHGYDEDDRLKEGKLDLLANSSEIKTLLTNPHLREMLTFIDSSKNKEGSMENAMKEPIFMEFADACLTLVESDSDGDKSPEPTEGFVEVQEFEVIQF